MQLSCITKTQIKDYRHMKLLGFMLFERRPTPKSFKISAGWWSNRFTWTWGIGHRMIWNKTNKYFFLLILSIESFMNECVVHFCGGWLMATGTTSVRVDVIGKLVWSKMKGTNIELIQKMTNMHNQIIYLLLCGLSSDS